MSEPKVGTPSRRDFLKSTGTLTAASALSGVALPHVHAQERNTVQLALIGCGGRGTGAVVDALSAKGPTKLVAMADVFDARLAGSHQAISGKFAPQVEVPADRRFIGFDGYRKAMDCLRPGDVAILTTPPAFRWVQFEYAIQKGLNVFMEKPIAVDGPSSRKMFKLGEESVKRNLKVGVGLMCRHCDARRELFARIQRGELGEVILLRAYRMAGPTGFVPTERKPEGISELMYQIQRFHAFLWASGGGFSDFLIHNIDESCWMKNAWPVRAEGSGGRHYRGTAVDQNFDSYSVEYTFADGSKFDLHGRTIAGCQNHFASYAHGSKGLAVISSVGHSPARSRIYKGHNITRSDLVWAFPEPEPNPYRVEWEELLEAIREDKPYNEVKRGAEASLVTAMGRLAAHTGQVITYDQMLNHPVELAPNVDKLTLDGPAPLQPLPDGSYPMPQPGILLNREY